MSQSIRELFDQALRIDEASRQDWLDKHCSLNSQKRKALDALLENSKNQHNFIRRTVNTAAQEILDSESDSDSGKYLALLECMEQLKNKR